MPKMKLTAIPIEQQAYILGKLFTQPLSCSKEPKEYTVERVTWCLKSFPDDLLHVAQASNTLANAVICTLGWRAKFLSFRRSIRLSEWIHLLAKHVKAFSLTGLDDLENCGQCFGEVDCGCYDYYKILLKTLEALHTNDVALVALNLEELEKPKFERIEEIAGHMVRALRRSGSSLREIAVNVNRATALTMPRVTLPNLEVLQISSEYYEDIEQMSVVPRTAKLFGDILQGIDGRICNLRDLRLLNMHEPPIFDRQSCPTFFAEVKKLTLMCGKTSKHREIANYIANFRSIEMLCWFTGRICPEGMSTIIAGCPYLRALHLSLSDRDILPGEVDLGENSNKLKELFLSFQGKLSILDMTTNLPRPQIASLGENCQNLLSLEMEIDNENVGALSLLLGTHCRMLRKLCLRYSKGANDCLGRDGWHDYKEGICSASDELRELCLFIGVNGTIPESATDEMALAISNILSFLRDRADCIVFRVPINTQNPFVVLEVLWNTFRVAEIHCRSLETFCLDFVKDYSLGGYRVEDVQEDDLFDRFLSVCRLQREFPLCEEEKVVDIGEIDALLGDQEDLEEEDVDELIANVPAELVDLLQW